MCFDERNSEISYSPRWYAVQTRSNFEKIVEAELRSKEIESYLPVLKEAHRWKDRTKLVQKPLFPGYLFAKFVDDPALKLRVLRTTGTVRIVGGTTSIEPIPEAEITNVRRLLSSGGAAFTHPFLNVGAWVRVKQGPLKGVEGVLESFRSSSRLVLSINLLSRSVATEIGLADVEPLRGGLQMHSGSVDRNSYEA